MHLWIALLLIAAGVAVTLATRETVWYGAVIVGALELVRGLRNLRRAAGNP